MISEKIALTIKEAVVINDVIQDYIKLTKNGANYKGCCPFHNEKTPSFVVSPSKGIFKCFGCGETGDAISFVMKHELVSYPQALRILAEKYNIIIPVEKTSEAEKAKKTKRDSLKELMSFAQKYFSDNISQAAYYIQKRQINDNSIYDFRIGYAIDSWDDFLKSAISSGFPENLLIEAGLRKQNEKNTYDYFRNRLMLPFFDVSGQVLHFTGRDLSGNSEIAKYLNGPDTEIFKKGDVLYGLFQAKRHIAKNDMCFLVEGNIDVISFHQKGVQNTVCGSGTAFTTKQAQLIKRFSDNVTIVYDGDNAGETAVFKTTDILLENGLNVRIVILPTGEDPDSFAQKQTENELNLFLNKSIDFIEYKFNVLKRRSKNQDASEMADIAKSVISSIALIPDNITRSLYVSKAIEKFKIDTNTVHTVITEIRKSNIIQERNLAKKNQENTETTTGWIGLDLAQKAIEKEDFVYITQNKDLLIQKITEGHENVILAIQPIKKHHIQELQSITTNIVIIDEIDKLCEKEFEETSLVLLCKTLYQAKFNVQCESTQDDETLVSFMDEYAFKAGLLIKSMSGDDRYKKLYTERVAELLSYADNTIITVYTDKIAKFIDIKATAFTKILKPYVTKQTTKLTMRNEGLIDEGEILQFDPERLPDYVDRDFFARYGFFPAQNKKGKKVAYVFRTDNGGLQTISNFYLEPLFHVIDKDKTKNKRIVMVNNGEQNKSFYLEMLSDDMIDFASFKKAMWREGGNYFTRGKSMHFEMVMAAMANKFPETHELTIFGQQHEGFFAFTNAIFSNNEIKYTDELGLVTHDDKVYYSPAYSKIYANLRKDNDQYENERNFVYRENTDTDFVKWAELMNQVYIANNNGKWATLFAVMSAFRSVIYPIDKLFTSLFFTGSTSSGKSQVAISIRSLFMAPETPLFNLNSGTDASFFTILEKYRDVPVIFEEYNDYQISDTKFQGLKAAVLDGEGKTKRKDATSKDLDQSKVNAVPLLLGQEGPERDDGSLGNRCVICHVPKKEDWSEEEIAVFQDLKKREKRGLTNILIEILRIRPMVETYFNRTQREVFKQIKEETKSKGAKIENRVGHTISLVLSTCKLLEKYAPHLKLPFTYEEFFEIAVQKIIAQSETIVSTNRLSVFFETIEILMLREKVIAGRDFKIETMKTITIMRNANETEQLEFSKDTKVLFVRLSNIHQHYTELKKGEALKMQNLMTYIKDSPAFIGNVKSTKFSWIEFKEQPSVNGEFIERKPIKAASNTSAIALRYDMLLQQVNIDLEKYQIQDEQIKTENDIFSKKDEDELLF